jgi:hypothetical protein
MDCMVAVWVGGVQPRVLPPPPSPPVHTSHHKASPESAPPSVCLLLPRALLLACRARATPRCLPGNTAGGAGKLVGRGPGTRRGWRG